MQGMRRAIIVTFIGVLALGLSSEAFAQGMRGGGGGMGGREWPNPAGNGAGSGFGGMTDGFSGMGFGAGAGMMGGFQGMGFGGSTMIEWLLPYLDLSQEKIDQIRTLQLQYQDAVYPLIRDLQNRQWETRRALAQNLLTPDQARASVSEMLLLQIQLQNASIAYLQGLGAIIAGPAGR